MRRHNPAHNARLLLTACSSKDLASQLTAYLKTAQKPPVIPRTTPQRPVIFCFGGQKTNYIGLSKDLYDSVAVLRHHLKACDEICHSEGMPSILPGIFDPTPIHDTVSLQTKLFATQYACAKSWMDSGLQPSALVGHSFGELTALCISGALDLRSALRLVQGRAAIIQKCWGTDPGAMMVVEGDEQQVRDLVSLANKCLKHSVCPVCIACFNCPGNFTLAGSKDAIRAVSQVLSTDPRFANLRCKQLDVTHAFHSGLVEHLRGELEQLGGGKTFGESTIPWERATYTAWEGPLTRHFVADHLRQPVYFKQAVERLGKQYPSAVWVEAGSGSTATTLAKRTLGNPSDCRFQAVDLQGSRALDSLTEATVKLWHAGVRVDFWAHHQLQTPEYSPLLLPPYQFEKTRHWLPTKRAPIRASEAGAVAKAPEQQTFVGLLSFVGFTNENKRTPRWKIHTEQAEYLKLIEGHVVAQTAAICPATLQVDLAIEALRKSLALLSMPNAEPCIQDIRNQAPVTTNPDRSLWIDFEGSQDAAAWTFRLSSSGSSQETTCHTTGRLVLQVQPNKALATQFAQYERLASHAHCVELLNSSHADDIVQGRHIYRMFSEIVDYGPQYQGLQKLVGHGTESAGLVVKKYNPSTWLDAHLSDAFCQVGGIWVNCMTDRPSSEMYIAGGVDFWMRRPDMNFEDQRTSSFHVLARHQRPNDCEYLSDVFIFDGTTGKLVEVLLGIQYRRVKKSSVQSFLLKATPQLAQQARSVSHGNHSHDIQATPATRAQYPKSRAAEIAPTESAYVAGAFAKTLDPVARAGVDSRRVKAILADLVGLDVESITDNHDLGDLGIDSLMSMEMVRELETGLGCRLDSAKMAFVTDMAELLACINAACPPEHMVLATTEKVDREESTLESAAPTATLLTPVSIATPALKSVSLYLADFLGLGQEDVTPEHKLIDLGVDSLLSLELKADMQSSLGLCIGEHFSVQDMTVGDLEAMLNQCSNGSEPSAGAHQTALLSTKQEPGSEAGKVERVHGNDAAPTAQLTLPHSLVQEAFDQIKVLTDDGFAEFGCDDFVKDVLPEMDKFCIALILEALDELGCSIKNAAPGQSLQYISCRPEHNALLHNLYGILQSEAGLVEITERSVRRTSRLASRESSERILHRLLEDFPAHRHAIYLTHYAGSHLAQVLTGETDGIRLIFGCEKGRRLVSSLYGDFPFNTLFYKQVETLLAKLASLTGPAQEPLRILEMGAGTAGTTKWLLPMLARLSIAVEYTFTDLAPSFVMAARKRFGAMYPFVKFRIHDIGKEPDSDLIGTQHIVVATNAVHATPDVVSSAGHMRKVLRPDGVLLMVEMTKPMHWVDLIFGLFEGWWVFNDGRTHAIAKETWWRSSLVEAGFNYIDWTDGQRPENEYERLIMATVSGLEKPIPAPVVSSEVQDAKTTCKQRLAVVEQYVQAMTEAFPEPARHSSSSSRVLPKTCVLVTGGSGSLGSFLLASLAQNDSITSVICLNRAHNGDAQQRQQDSFDSKGISLAPEALSKVRVLEANMSEPRLGLAEHVYTRLVTSVTHIVHNAWHMNGKATIQSFKPQFDIMSNMTRLASDIASYRGEYFKPSFVFVSSIAVTGHYPLCTGNSNVPEQRMSLEAVLPNGYGDAKFACEQMLDRTLHQYPDRFRVACVRLGQVAGSTKTGYWNCMEHVPMLFKSCRSVNALPKLQGRLSWTPIEDVAGTVADLLLVDHPHPVYHVENPVGQSWQDMIPVLARGLSIPQSNVIPFADWIAQIRQSPMAAPIKVLIDFIEKDFERMSCGDLVLETTLARKHSKTLRAVAPVSDEVALRYARAWCQ